MQNANVDVEPFDGAADIAEVRNLIERHVSYTRSPKGQWVLEHWDTMVPRFKKIFPRELKRALREAQQRAVLRS